MKKETGKKEKRGEEGEKRRKRGKGADRAGPSNFPKMPIRGMICDVT